MVNFDSTVQYNFIFVFKDKSTEPQEIKFSKLIMQELAKSLLALKEASLTDCEPSLQLFIIKQTFVTGLGPKMGFGWSETKVRPRTPRDRVSAVADPNKPKISYMERAAMVKHAQTPEGFACLEFRVRKLRAESASGKPEELTIHVLQNN